MISLAIMLPIEWEIDFEWVSIAVAQSTVILLIAFAMVRGLNLESAS